MSYSRGQLHPVTGKPMTAIEYNELALKHGWESMPDWEAKLRDKLYNELPSEMYEIGGPGMIAWTGKGGKIEFEVAVQKHIREMIALLSEEVPKVVYKKIPYNKLKQVLTDFFYGKK